VKENAKFKILKTAYALLKKGEVKSAISLLEQVVTSFGQEEPYPYFLLAVAYLYNDKFDFANTIINRLRKNNPDYLPLVQLQGFMNFKSATVSGSALNTYLSLYEKYPNDKTIKKTLELIRRSKNFNKFQKVARLNDFVKIPSPPSHLKKIHENIKKTNNAVRKNKSSFPIKNILIVSVFAIAIFFVSFYFIKRYLNQMDQSASQKVFKDLNYVNLESSNSNLLNRINKKEYPEFYLSSKIVNYDFHRAKRLIKTKKYNEALKILNKLYNSNVNFAVKEKINFLIKFVMDLDDRVFQKIPYKKIMEKPYLYHGSAITFKGKIANIRNKTKSKSFNLLVNYKQDGTFSGILDVYLATKEKIKNGDTLKVEGLFIYTGSKDKSYLSAKNIYF